MGRLLLSGVKNRSAGETMHRRCWQHRQRGWAVRLDAPHGDDSMGRTSHL